MELRGGTGRVFNNSAPNASSGVWLMLNEYYVINDHYNAGNYPVDDQIGIGKDPKVGGSETDVSLGKPACRCDMAIDAYADMTGVINPDRDYFK